MKLTTYLLLLLSLATPTRAAFPFPETRTITVPDSNAMETSVRLQLNGRARCLWGFFRFKLYDAALYLEQTSRDPETIMASTQTKQIELFFLRKLNQQQLAKAYRASVQANTEKDMETYEAALNDLCDLLPLVRKGDRLTFTILPKEGLRIRHNQRVLGTIADPAFPRLFVKLYIGPRPPTAAVRTGLLGLDDEP